MAFRIIIHGGAGAMRNMGTSAEAQYRAGLIEATAAGAGILREGGSAREAVVSAVSWMERCGAFNAGRGSALSSAGEIEADAAVMDGNSLAVGAVAAVPGLTNAVAIAEDVLKYSPHCLLAGSPVLDWAREQGTDIECFPIPETRYTQYRHLIAELGVAQHADDLVDRGGTHDLGDTVGAVAMDESGALATAVSTGGIWLKTSGRVGDSPLVGGGLWADSSSGASCATGTGEYIIRSMLIARISIGMEQGLSSSESVVQGLDWLKQRFGSGKAGVIAIDRLGGMTARFDTAGMGRGWMTDEMKSPMVAVWPEEAFPQPSGSVGAHTS